MTALEHHIPNRLIREKSPYLLQHARNPVDWFPWGDEAFRKAQQEQKLIFLSIGYSTCYWCHVMEREVFENTDIAAQMNRHLVCIKVDREERPDIDRIYMGALQAMSGSGGWPMSMFLTPDLRPFYGATYIPPAARYGRPGFPELLRRIVEVWETRREEITTSGQSVLEHLEGAVRLPSSDVIPGAEVLDRGFDVFIRAFDDQHGGFGGAPKFPRPSVLRFLHRYHHRTGQEQALDASFDTLLRMAAGGMYDHVGGGFHRYSTDREWHVPHFEKMLYDQAQLVVAYLEAFQIGRRDEFAAVARDVLAYVGERLTSPEGVWYSAEDAESAQADGTKKEGAYYVWTETDIRAALTPEETTIVSAVFDVRAEGNASADPSGEFRGLNILRRVLTDHEAAERAGTTAVHVPKVLNDARQKLKQVRNGRPRPHLDDKVILSWNGMMLSAYAKAYRVLGEEPYLAQAERAADALVGLFLDPGTGSLRRRYRDGETKFEAGLEDYAFFVQGLLDLYEAGFSERYLRYAAKLAGDAVTLFHDDDRGGFYDTTGNDATLILRTKEFYDGAEPSGNAVLCLAVLRLSRMLHDDRLRTVADRTLRAFGRVLEQSPTAVPHLMLALDDALGPSMEVVVAGDGPEMPAMLRTLHQRYNPRAVVLRTGAPTAGVEDPIVPVFARELGAKASGAVVYVCENFACDLPAVNAAEVADRLDRRGVHPG